MDGVLGIYSGEFPSPGAKNGLDGWAWWSGTSFATAIISGIAANFWGQQRSSHAIAARADLHAEASANGSWQPELRTPVVKVERRMN